MKIGLGYDTHVFGKNRNLIIGGVNIPYEYGLVGHSDADVLTHAIMDSLLGAAGFRDIGYYFSDRDSQYKNSDSIQLLIEVLETKIRPNFKIVNIDSVLIGENPKFSSHIENICYHLTNVIQAPVNVKATTTEKMNAEGQGKCLSCQAISLLEEL